MTVLIDEPRWPAHGMLWSHLISDTSLEELHEFARLHGIPVRGFDLDHYDVPARMYDELIAASAEPVSVREFVERMRASGLRVSQRERRSQAGLAQITEPALGSSTPLVWPRARSAGC